MHAWKSLHRIRHCLMCKFSGTSIMQNACANYDERRSVGVWISACMYTHLFCVAYICILLNTNMYMFICDCGHRLCAHTTVIWTYDIYVIGCCARFWHMLKWRRFLFPSFIWPSLISLLVLISQKSLDFFGMMRMANVHGNKQHHAN